jgi:hypothetical protein
VVPAEAPERREIVREFKGFKFCQVLDGLLYERARLTAVKVVANYGGGVYWLHRLLVSRALTKNLKQIRIHECALCQCSFGGLLYRAPAEAYQLMEEELMSLQEEIQSYLKHEIEEDGLLD